MRRRTLVGLAGLLALALLTSACGTVRGPRQVIVGSKADTEGAILGYLAFLLLEDAGFRVSDRIEMGPTLIVRQALLHGEIDLYPEYTGTALGNFFSDPDLSIRSETEEVFEYVRRRDAEENDLVWTFPLSINNTYTVLIPERRADALHLESLSDLAAYLRKGSRYTIASDGEFLARDDGMPGLLDAYGLRDLVEVRQMNTGLVYGALVNRDIDLGVGYSTDGRIPGMDLRMLRDDRSFFPAYQATYVAREALLDRHPEVLEALEPLQEHLTEAEVARLNYQMDVERRKARAVAREWLLEKGLLTGPGEQGST